MSRKSIIALIALLAGIGLIIYSIHGMHEAAEAKGFISDAEDFFTHNTMWNPIIEFFGGEALEEASKYDVPLLLMLIVGIILTILSTVYLIKKYRRDQLL